MSASRTGPTPMVRRAVKPVETPKSIRPGASALSDISALAATGALRFEGISTPVPRRILDVSAAAPMRVRPACDIEGLAACLLGSDHDRRASHQGNRPIKLIPAN